MQVGKINSDRVLRHVRSGLCMHHAVHTSHVVDRNRLILVISQKRLRDYIAAIAVINGE